MRGGLSLCRPVRQLLGAGGYSRVIKEYAIWVGHFTADTDAVHNRNAALADTSLARRQRSLSLALRAPVKWQTGEQAPRGSFRE